MDSTTAGPIAMAESRTVVWESQDRRRSGASARRVPSESRRVNTKPKKNDCDEDGSDSLDANEILLQLNGDPCCNGTSSSGESSEGGESFSTNDVVHPRLEESDAKRQVELIFRTPACWRSESDQTHLLYLLQRFPVLASQNFDWDYNLFWQHGNEWSSPLCFLLASGANLETIKAAYHLFPAAISRPQGVNRELPLHFACRFGVSEDVLVFLVQRFPYAVMVSNSSGMLPIHCALGKKDIFPYGQFTHASLETVKVLVELYPQCLLKEEQQRKYTPLQIAFNHAYSFEVIDYLIGMMPAKIDSFDLTEGCYHNKRFALNFDLGESILASNLISRLKRFNCAPTNWKKEGLVQVLTCLEQNTSLIDFKATNLTPTLLQDENVMDALQGVFRSNKTLRTVGLSLKSDAEENSDTSLFFGCLDRGLQGNRTLQSLELEQFPVSCMSLNHFLSSGNIPPVLKMTAFTVFRGQAETARWDRPVLESRVDKIILSGFNFPPNSASTDCEHFVDLLCGIAFLPRLKELTLNLPKLHHVDISSPLVHILESQSLERLTVRGPKAQVDPICAALRFNTTLRYLNFPALTETTAQRAALAHVLENHNAKVEFVQLPKRRRNEEDRETKKILYLTRLNSFGRSYVRESNARRKVLVSLLEDFASQSQELQPDEKLSIHFGLLRETPSLWCNALPGGESHLYPRCKKRQRTL